MNEYLSKTTFWIVIPAVAGVMLTFLILLTSFLYSEIKPMRNDITNIKSNVAVISNELGIETIAKK